MTNMPPSSEDRPGAAYALGQMDARIATAVALGSAHWAPLFASPTPTVVVGAGGSHPAAEFIARLLREAGTPARSAYPLDASGPERRLVLISYSGSTPDLIQTVHTARRNFTCEVILITGSSSPTIPADLILYHRPSQLSTPSERGFLSFAATLAPIAAALAPLIGAEPTLTAYHSGRVHGDLSLLVDAPVVDVIATGYGWPTALDLESKWTEADLGPLRIHEQKNLSHGRYQSVLRPPPQPSRPHLLSPAPLTAILITTGPEHGYTRHLREILSRRTALIQLSSELSGPAGGLGALATSQKLCVEVGAARGVDVSRPNPIAPEGLPLYSWDWASETSDG